MFISLFFNLRGLRCGLPSAEQTALVVPSARTLEELTPALKETRDRLYSEYDKTPGSYLEKGVIVQKEMIPVPVDGTRTAVDVRKIHSIRSALLQSRFSDEQKMITSLTNINPGRLRFNPHFFQYGGIFVYSAGLAIKISQLLGLTRITPDITYYFSHPGDISNFFTAPKALCGILETLSIPLIFILGKMLFGSAAGLLSAVFLALIPSVPVEAHALKPYILFFPFMISALIFSKNIMESRRSKDYILAGIFCGLSAGTLIFSGVVGVSALCAHFLSFRNKESLKTRLLDKNILLLALSFLAAFFAANPYWIPAFNEVRADFAYLSREVAFHVSGKNMLYHLLTEFPKAFGQPVYVMGVFGLLLSLKRFTGADKLLLAAFLPAYFYLVCTLWYFFHYSMPLVPVFVIFAGRLGAFLIEKLKSRVLSYGLLAVVSLYTFGYSFYYSNIFAGFNGFSQAEGRWINENIPKGSSINCPVFPNFASEGYPPFSILNYKINEPGLSDYVIVVDYKAPETRAYAVPVNYALVRRSVLDKGVLGRVYKREALAFLDPEISVYKLK